MTEVGAVATVRSEVRPWAVASMVVGAVLGAVYAVAALAHAGVLGTSALPGHLGEPIGALLFVAWLVASTWLVQAMATARGIDPEGQWAASDWTGFTAWVIPVFSLFAPYVVVRDVRRVAGLRRPSSGLLLWLWWPAFVVTTWGVHLVGGRPPAHGTHGHHVAAVVYLACDVVACLTWLVVVRTTTTAITSVVEPVETPREPS